MNAPEAVYLHAWRLEDGDSTYCEANEGPEGWCVYTRHTGEENAPFDLSDELDFPDYATAHAEGEARAARLNVELREY